jgi:hypothetical protein
MSDGPQRPASRTQRAVKWTIFLGATATVVSLRLLILGPFVDVIVAMSRVPTTPKQQA